VIEKLALLSALPSALFLETGESSHSKRLEQEIWDGMRKAERKKTRREVVDE
jgi:hypothetical protein